MARFPALFGGGDVPATEPGAEVVNISPRGLPKLIEAIQQRQSDIAQIDVDIEALNGEIAKLRNEREQQSRRLKEDQERLAMIVSPLMTETGQ